jgi:vacuolar-type H+-ATPase subunit H
LSSTIEETVKALVEFESELDAAKAEVSDLRKRTLKDAADWAEGAKNSAMSKAQEIATQRVAKAREEAEAEADAIRKKGESDLKVFESSISRNKSKAASLVTSRLLGETE